MNYKLLCYRIKMAREKRRLTQETLSEIMDISPTHMSVIERGVKGMKLSTFEAMKRSDLKKHTFYKQAKLTDENYPW